MAVVRNGRWARLHQTLQVVCEALGLLRDYLVSELRYFMSRVSKLFTAVAAAATLACAAVVPSQAAPAATDANSNSISVFYYSLNDLFINQLSAALQDRALANGIKLRQYDASDDLMRQISQIQSALVINKDGAPILVNPVDTQNGIAALRSARQNKVPIIFFNRKPSDEALASYEDAWYVGSNPSNSGFYQAEIVRDYFKAHPEADRNKDGVISYVMLKGEPSHQDTALRSNTFVRTLLEDGVKLKPIASINANWSQNRAQNEVSTLADRGQLAQIELIVCNNDAMALGAINALQAEGYNIPNTPAGDHSKYIPVVGIDALPQALDAVERGTMIGTVFNDYGAVADVMMRITEAYLNGEHITDDILGYTTNGHVIDVPYVKVTNENLSEVR